MHTLACNLLCTLTVATGKQTENMNSGLRCQGCPVQLRADIKKENRDVEIKIQMQQLFTLD